MIIVLHKSGATPNGKEIGENKGWQGKDSLKYHRPESHPIRKSAKEFHTLYLQFWFREGVKKSIFFRKKS